MTLPEVQELLDYWQECPPTHVLVAAYLGHKGKKSSKISKDEQDTAVSAFIGMLGGQIRIEQGVKK